MTRQAVDAECGACKGTGLYQGFMERADEAVICVNCRGSCKVTINFNPFTGRKKRKGVEKIRGGTGLIIDQPTKGSWMSYADFEVLVPKE